MTDMRTSEEYQRYMTELAERIGDVIDGELLSDIATVSVGIAARAVEELCPDPKERAALLMTLVRFMFDRAGIRVDVDIDVHDRLH